METTKPHTVWLHLIGTYAFNCLRLWRIHESRTHTMTCMYSYTICMCYKQPVARLTLGGFFHWQTKYAYTVNWNKNTFIRPSRARVCATLIISLLGSGFADHNVNFIIVRGRVQLTCITSAGNIHGRDVINLLQNGYINSVLHCLAQ